MNTLALPQVRYPKHWRGWVFTAFLVAAGPRCCGCDQGTAIDDDNDGYLHSDSTAMCQLDPFDCDDSDPTIYPGAEDPEGDDIDQNCDGVDGVATP